MVILFRGTGNHTNKLFQAVHLEAFCLENHVRYYNPSLGPMARYYGVRYTIFDSLLSFVIIVLNKLRLVRIVDFTNPDEIQSYYRRVAEDGLVLARGWYFRASDLTKKYREYFVRKYSLLPHYYRGNELYQKLAGLDRHQHVLVGIHIRKRDYKTWENGKYFFGDDVYQKAMKNFSAQYSRVSRKNVLFVMFSDEPITIPEDENIIISLNPWYVDHVLMSQCDYLIGPPSTFTMWASYISNALYFHIKDEAGIVNLDEFKHCDG